jgi:hypothetical protein
VRFLDARRQREEDRCFFSAESGRAEQPPIPTLRLTPCILSAPACCRAVHASGRVTSRIARCERLLHVYQSIDIAVLYLAPALEIRERFRIVPRPSFSKPRDYLLPGTRHGFHMTPLLSHVATKA